MMWAQASASDSGSWCFSGMLRKLQTSGSRVGHRPQVFRASAIVQRNGKPLWSSLEDAERRAQIKNQYTLIETSDKTYMCYQARIIDELPDAAPQREAR